MQKLLHIDWVLIFGIIYIILIVLVCLRIVYDTRNNDKTLSYLLLVIFLPVIGTIFYFSLGINYRKRKIYTKKLIENKNLAKKLKAYIFQHSRNILEENKTEIKQNKELALMLLKESMSPLTTGNEVKLLINGEEKFPEVLQVLHQAKNHIHIEYYIYEDDVIGNEIANVLIQKAGEGVAVRFIYDAFGSRSIRKNLVKRLKAAGVQAFPFYKIIFIALANRLNYRNHRKIIVVDGRTAFVGGINVSDRYINEAGTPNQLFWRDTHLRIDGHGVHYLQFIFLRDWNFCAKQNIHRGEEYFPRDIDLPESANKLVQIAASGPDSDTPTIMFSILQAINLATKEILVTTPYFIPGSSLIDALTIAALSGISVKLLIPGKSDSLLVNLAAHSNYDDLLQAGVEIYKYTKGFVHAKTMVTDRSIAIVGTANMDTRSFDLNFEVNAIVYDQEIASQLAGVFYEDLKNAEKIDIAVWNNRPWYRQLLEQTARLVSPLL